MHPNQAAVLISVLEDHGIEARLTDVHSVGMVGILGMMTPHKLLVPEEQAAEAETIIHSFDTDESPAEFTRADGMRADEEGICPSCESPDVSYSSRRAMITAVMVVFLGCMMSSVLESLFIAGWMLSICGALFTYFRMPKNHCEACGFYWRGP